MGDEADVQLARMRRALAKLAREGREREFDAVAAAYAALKAQRMEQAEREHMEAVRARRVARVAERPSPGPGRWRPPAGFGVSPGAVQRAREGVAGGGLVPDSRRRVLAPWRRGHPASEVVWRPGV